MIKVESEKEVSPPKQKSEVSGNNQSVGKGVHLTSSGNSKRKWFKCKKCGKKLRSHAYFPYCEKCFKEEVLGILR